MAKKLMLLVVAVAFAVVAAKFGWNPHNPHNPVGLWDGPI